MYYLYIIRSSNGNHYTGQTNNLHQRLKTHRRKKYLKDAKIIHLECFDTRKEACSRESQFKYWRKIDKENIKKGIKKPAQIWRQKIVDDPYFYDELIDKIILRFEKKNKVKI